MKIRNFTELDKILKRSFSGIRKEVVQGKKVVDSKVDDIKKNTVHDKTVWDTKIKFLTSEIRKLKDAHGDLHALQKAQVEKLSAANQKHVDALKQHVSHEVTRLGVETDRLKDDIVKLVAVLKEKMVTKKLFDDRNQAYETNIRELLELTKDVKEFKLGYLSQLQIKKQLSTAREDIDVLKDEIAAVNEELGELRSTTQTVATLREELPARFVEKSEFSQKLAVFDRISTSVDKIDETVADLTVLKEQVLQAAKAQEGLTTLKKHVDEELREVRNELSTANEAVTQLREQDHSETLDAQKDVLEELRAKVNTLETELTKREAQEDTQKSITAIEENIEELRDELLGLPELTKEVEKLKKGQEQLLLKVDAQEAKVELMEATTPTKKKVREEKIQEQPEEVGEDASVSEVAQETEEEQGIFSKTVKGIADFFIEEELPEQQETKTEAKVEEKEAVSVEAKKPDNEQFIKNIEKLFDEPEQNSFQFDVDVHSEIEAQKPGIFSRLKSGVVNFLFEEVEEPAETEAAVPESGVFQTSDELINEAKEESNVVWKTSEKSQKTAKTKGKKTLKKLVKTAKKKEDDEPKAKTEKLKKEPVVEVYEAKEDKDQYMTNRKPRIFDEEEAEEESNGKKKKYKKIKGNDSNDPFAEDVAEEVLYPEDYFY